jgi:hypothetical protein
MKTPLAALLFASLPLPALAVPPNNIYHVRAPSAIGESCLLGCTCDSQRNEPLRGSFALTPTSSDSILESFSITNIYLRGATSNQSFTGNGTYTVGGLAGFQIISADISIDGAPASHAESGRTAYGPHTAVDMTISVPTSACSGTVLDIVATPLASDWNADGEVTTADIFDFINSWLAGDGDADEDGRTTASDIFTFLNAWLAGQ